jgi:predicted DNA-binding transcriptional regulator AlpA
MRRALAEAPAAAEAAPASPRALKRSLRLPELMLRTGLKKTAIYAAIKRGELPAPKKLGRASIWPEEAVQAALDALPSGCM